MNLLGCSLIGLLQRTVYACRILSSCLSHAGTAAAATAYTGCNRLDQIACMSALLLCCVSSCCHQIHLISLYGSKDNHTFAQFLHREFPSPGS